MKKREILFRGERIDNCEWAYGYYANCTHPCGQEDHTGHYIITYPGNPKYYHEIYTNTLGQYTGKCDKSGKAAFEDDCIRELDGDAIGVIRYGEYENPFNDGAYACHVGFYVDWASGTSNVFLRKDLGYWLRRAEVVGNIHDNPEMLKGGKGDV